MKTNSPLSGLVCTKPSAANAGTEAKVAITFPSDFTINETTSTWTTSTSNLPAGASAWPSIGGSATSVVTRTVTFSGGDLTNGSTLYCFNFTGSSSTTGNTGEKTGSITTKNSSDTTIDSSSFGVTIGANDQVTVSATVSANSSDYSTSITKITEGEQFAQDKTIEYQITYGTTLNYSTSITLEASWSQGTIEGESTPSVDVLKYVSGSASNAYNSTPPVIDSVNKKITWEISSFPGNTTNQTVSFKLKTTSNYTGSPRVSFTTSGRVLFPGGATSYSNSSAYYKYASSSSGSSTSSSTTTTTTTTTTPSTALSIDLIEVRTVTENRAVIYVTTTPETSKIIRYGKSISSLSQSISVGLSKANLISLTGLDSSTTYYFQATVTDQSGKKLVSDIYTFKTAQKPSSVKINTNSIVAVSNNSFITRLTGASDESQKKKILIVPNSTVFKFKFSITNTIDVVEIKAVVRPKNVLGVSIPSQAQASTDSVNLIEVEPGVYEGTLKTKREIGEYVIIAQIKDVNGNLFEEKITDLKVVKRFSVTSKNTKKPIEGARVMLSIFNPTTKRYVRIPSSNLSMGNPSFTDSRGEIDFALPVASYQAEITTLGHEDQVVHFKIGQSDGDGYPQVKMTDTGITILRLIRYFYRTANDVFIFHTQIYAYALTDSIRFFDLVAAVILGSLVLFALVSFSKKHHIPLSKMISYFYYLLDHRGNPQNYVTGVIYDNEDHPIPSANVYLSDSEDDRIISSTKTNSRGEFFFRRQDNKKYYLLAMAKNHKTSSLIPYEGKFHLHFKITLEKDDSVKNFLSISLRLINEAFGLAFEGILLLSLIFEILFITNFGIVKTLPFLLLSIFNLLIWTLHLRHSRYY